MSPIIYTPHRCTPAEDPDVVAMSDKDLEGATWRCPDCDAYWEPKIGMAFNGVVRDFSWTCTGRPREQAHLREVEAALEGAATPSVPTVTDRMVQLVLDTYTDHTSVTPNDGAEPLGWCGECETGIYGPHTSQAHAREMAANALQDALRGETHE